MATFFVTFICLAFDFVLFMKKIEADLSFFPTITLPPQVKIWVSLTNKSFVTFNYNHYSCQQFQNRRMKWKRSRKAQQESKNKDNHGNNNSEEKQPRERSSNQSSTFKNGNIEKSSSNSTSSNFHFPKNTDALALPSHPAVQHHLNSLPGSSKEISSHEENYSSNVINRQQTSVFSDSDDMIWRVV